MPQLPILVAIPDEWSAEVAKILKSQNFDLLTAASLDEALTFIQFRGLRAIVITSDWAIGDESGDFIEMARARFPIMTLVKRETLTKYGQELVWDKVYSLPTQEFCTVPFDAEELLRRLERILRATDVPSK